MWSLLAVLAVLTSALVFWTIQRRRESAKATERRRVILELYKQLDSEL